MTIAQGSATILLVEDGQALREMIAEMMESAGHTVLAARSPAEAVRIAQQHSGPIDLLLTDVVMPGMRGPELAETLRAIRPGLKALLMSGYTHPTADADGPGVVNADFIQKPFSEAALLAKVSGARAPVLTSRLRHPRAPRATLPARQDRSASRDGA